MALYQLTAFNVILRTSDNAFIPMDPENTDYMEYLKWIEEGNVPDPYIAPPDPPLTATPLQFRLGLSKVQLRSSVEMWTASADIKIQDLYKYSSVFSEKDEFVTAMAARYLLNEKQIYDMFLIMQTLSL